MTAIEVDCETVKSRLDAGEQVVLIDCREGDEYQVVKIEHATLIPMSQFVERVTELEPHRDTEIIIHCHHGGRSLRVAMWLRQQGYAYARSMAGGIDRWAEVIEPGLPRY